MSDLLPHNATAQEHALDDAVARIAEVPVLARAVWNPDDCPIALLPWLAWAFSVDDWDAGWTEQQKRDTIKAAIEVQKIKGTIGSVRSALAALGIDVRVQEWFNQIPAGDPYTYQVLFDANQTPVTQQDLIKAVALVDTNKSLRSHLTGMAVTATSESNVSAAAAGLLGSEVTISNFQPALLVINQHAIVAG